MLSWRACRLYLVAAVALALLGDASAGRRRRRSSDRKSELMQSDDMFTWTCGKARLNDYLNANLGPAVAAHACVRTGKRRLRCILLTPALPKTNVPFSVKCGKRGFKKLIFTDAPNKANPSDLSVFSLSLEGVSPADVGTNALKGALAGILNDGLGGSPVQAQDVVIFDITAGSAVVAGGILGKTAAACAARRAMEDADGLVEALTQVSGLGAVTGAVLNSFALCKNCNAASCPAASTTTKTTTTTTTTTASIAGTTTTASTAGTTTTTTAAGTTTTTTTTAAAPRVTLSFATLDFSNFDSTELRQAIIDSITASSSATADDIAAIYFYEGSVIAEVVFEDDATSAASDVESKADTGLSVSVGGEQLTPTRVSPPPPPAPPPTAPPGEPLPIDRGWFMGSAGQSCADVCGAFNRECSDTGRRRVNNIATFKAALAKANVNDAGVKALVDTYSGSSQSSHLVANSIEFAAFGVGGLNDCGKPPPSGYRALCCCDDALCASDLAPGKLPPAGGFFLAPSTIKTCDLTCRAVGLTCSQDGTRLVRNQATFDLASKAAGLEPEDCTGDLIDVGKPYFPIGKGSCNQLGSSSTCDASFDNRLCCCGTAAECQSAMDAFTTTTPTTTTTTTSTTTKRPFRQDQGYVLSLEGENCVDACFNHGRTCFDTLQSQLNYGDLVRAALFDATGSQTPPEGYCSEFGDGGVRGRFLFQSSDELERLRAEADESLDAMPYIRRNEVFTDPRACMAGFREFGKCSVPPPPDGRRLCCCDPSGCARVITAALPFKLTPFPQSNCNSACGLGVCSARGNNIINSATRFAAAYFAAERKTSGAMCARHAGIDDFTSAPIISSATRTCYYTNQEIAECAVQSAFVRLCCCDEAKCEQLVREVDSSFFNAWVLGENAETCTTVCSKRSRTCNAQGHAAITSADRMRSALFDAGVVYTDACRSGYRPLTTDATPFIADGFVTSSGSCLFNPDGVAVGCDVPAPPSTITNRRRLCCCSTTAACASVAMKFVPPA